MSIANGIPIVPETLRTVAFGGIGAAYSELGDPFDNAIRLISFKNFTNETLTFSFDGVNDHEILLENSAIILDLTSNSSNHFFPVIRAGTQIWVKATGALPASGAAYMSAYRTVGD